MFILWEALNLHHPTISFYAQGVERNTRRLEEEKVRAGKVTEFRAYDWPLETVLSFKYL